MLHEMRSERKSFIELLIWIIHVYGTSAIEYRITITLEKEQVSFVVVSNI